MVNFEKPKGEKPKGEKPKFKIYEKIDTTKSLESIIKENIPNFKCPSDGKEFIENLIILDYIISEKYKKNKTIFDENINFCKYPGFEDLSLFFKSRNLKVYYDDSISEDFYKQLRQYYKSENCFKKKIRIRLNLNEKVLQDEKKVESIVAKISDKVSEIIKVKKEDLYVTNVRKNCLLLDIFVLSITLVTLGLYVNLLIGEINEQRLIRHKEEFKRFLEEIVDENNGNNIHFLNQIGENESEEVVVDIKNALGNYVSTLTPEKFDYRYDKRKGNFGKFLFFFHFKFTEKNGKTYYYPSSNCEGYGLRVNRRRNNGEDIFDSRGDWCIVYSSILKDKIYYNINQFSGGYIEKSNLDNSVTKFRLFFQCKAKISSITENLDGSLIVDLDYLVPYRLIKENLD